MLDKLQHLGHSDAPIGVFDSGIGGLSVVAELRALLPHESMVYLADTAHVPYGTRPDEEIRILTACAVEWLYQRGCKAVVVACNTASAFSLTHLRARYGESFPVIGLVPAVKPAVQMSKNKKIGVLATQGTMRGTLLKDVIAEVAVPAGVEVFTVVSPALVPFVEAGEQDSEACYAELERVLAPLVEAKAEELVLGCTHYPFLASSIQHVFPDKFHLLDSGAAVAKQTERVLAQRRLLTSATGVGTLDCFVTGEVEPAERVMRNLVDWDFKVETAIYDLLSVAAAQLKIASG
ncbi:glutamate racemase [Aquirhabdus parva]|uniref:Glutamate racemase n=1 Tax=Aquirhabdus parva TaxID=2283318 RepID=A0A345P4P6_9GAMM|nr:glutamate racemase [Aquirhabdus parva]AXI02255.1 glutamate racemase [Aquirhabdus parva]